MSAAAKNYWSDKELLALPKNGYDHEIIRGVMVSTPCGFLHSATISRLACPLATYVSENDLGCVVDGQTGYRMNSGDVLTPDASFISVLHWQNHRRSGHVFYHGAADLVIEVLCPKDTPQIIKEKTSQYFVNGSQLIWLVDPETRTARVCRSDGTFNTIPETGALNGENVVPGFELTLHNVFPE